VIAVGEHGAASPRTRPAAADRLIDVLGSGDLKPLHPAGEGDPIIRLDEQVHVGALDTDVDDPDVTRPRRGERGLADRVIHDAAAQAPHRLDDSQGDVHRMMPR
jgi:hypothetical protein